MKHWYKIIVFWGLIAIACDPCEDCGEPFFYDPTVKFIFINQDSANALQDSMSYRSGLIRNIDSIRRIYTIDIDSLQDTLEVLSDSIDDGVPGYEDDTAAIGVEIRRFEDSVSVLNKTRSVIDSVNKHRSNILKVINSGKLRVSKATILENGSSLPFEDSATIFPLPLLMEGGSTTYDIEIFGDDTTITISMNYKLQESVTESRVYQIIATQIQPKAISNDTLSVVCKNPENCISNETTVTVYF